MFVGEQYNIILVFELPGLRRKGLPGEYYLFNLVKKTKSFLFNLIIFMSPLK